jgi:hypothetical protein
MSTSADKTVGKNPPMALANSRDLVTAIWQVSAPGQRVISETDFPASSRQPRFN